MTTDKLQSNIRQVVDQVVSLTQPLRIILFGSAATGKAGPGSDLDFLVVVPEHQPLDKILDRLNTKLRPRPMPCDFLITTPSRLKRNGAAPGLIYREILQHGRDVYVAT